jgi:hypothetical protein
MNARWRIIGPEVVAKREQVELYYRAAITNVLDPYNITMRFFNYTSCPAATSGRGVKWGPCCCDAGSQLCQRAALRLQPLGCWQAGWS